MAAETRRQREKAIHLRQILQAAEWVFAKKGFAARRLRDVHPPVLATALFGLIRSFTEQWVLTGSRDALTPISPVTVELLFVRRSKGALFRSQGGSASSTCRGDG